MRKSHECHSEPQAKNLAFPATCEDEILRLSPHDEIATQSVAGEDKDKGAGQLAPSPHSSPVDKGEEVKTAARKLV
jgi:hypothetical protein